MATSLSVFSFPKNVISIDHDEARRRMVEQDLRQRDITDEKVLKAMSTVPRHKFVLPRYESNAYADSPLPIREKQTISQPYIVALMTQSARLRPSDRVLEIGTGSGYQAAVLAEVAKEVYTIEIVETLAKEAGELLEELGYSNVKVRYGDGYKGWAEASPFDAILITAAAPKIPRPLIEQLKISGRLVMPLGPRGFYQELIVFTKTESGLERKFITGVAFVPMTGEVQKD